MARPIEDLLRSWVERRPNRTTPTEPVPETPGRYPYTRGINPRGYQDQLWVMGQYSGYASAAETNRRFKDLIAAGQTGLSIALDLPTQIGLDPDHPLAEGEVGKVGVTVATVDDVIALLEGVPLDRVRQMRTTANAIGPIFVAFLSAALEELGADPKGFRFLMQNDPLKEFSSRGTFIFPPRPSLKLAVDVVEHFAANYPHWEPIEFCGYHVRDSGGTPVQEVAVATANGIAYLDEARSRGVNIESIAHSLFIFLSAGVEILEEAAKIRAARRLWARLLHEHYGVPEGSAGVNMFVFTLGGALVAQEPLNNVVRVAYEALAAVLGGTQTLSCSSYDEALSLPSKGAAHLSLRTQQILGLETGVTRAVDPLGGSYYVEALTDRLESEIVSYLLKVQEHGGAVGALESGFIIRELAESAHILQKRIESGEHPVVGVNIHKAPSQAGFEAFTVPEETQRQAVERLEAVRRHRDEEQTKRSLAAVSEAAREQRNTIPALIEAARARASLGEMVGSLASVYGWHASSAAY